MEETELIPILHRKAMRNADLPDITKVVNKRTTPINVNNITYGKFRILDKTMLLQHTMKRVGENEDELLLPTCRKKVL